MALLDPTGLSWGLFGTALEVVPRTCVIAIAVIDVGLAALFAFVQIVRFGTNA